MPTDDFFTGIEHVQVSWREYNLHVPVFYQDFRFMTASYLIPQQALAGLLPSTRLKPYRIMPGKTLIFITAYEYRESDIGPYNEVGISIPVTLDQPTPLFTGVLRKPPSPPSSFFLHLPVTTQIALDVGVEFAGYPKFLARIEFEEDDDWLACTLAHDDQHILTLKGRKLPTNPAARFRANPLTFSDGYLLRSQFIINRQEIGFSNDARDVTLTLGEHPIAKTLRTLSIGKMSGYSYIPRAQGILTQVIESFAA